MSEPETPDPPRSHRVSFVRAFLASAAATGLSRVLGAARDVCVAAVLGTSAQSDAFNLAYTIPNVFRRFVADEGLTGAMIPALARAEADGGVKEARRLADQAFTALVLGNIVLVVLGVLFAEPIVLAFAWSWRDDPELLALTVSMTRWLFPFVAMVSLVSYFEGLLNYRGHFFIPKFAPAFVSAGVVAGAVILGGWFETAAWAMVVGTLVGGLLHVLVNLVPLARRWGRVALTLDLRSPRLRSVGVEMSKVIAIGIFAQINLLVLQQLATSLPTGTLTIYRNATHMTDLAQGIVAVAIGSALLPNISASVASEDWPQFERELTGALRLAAFLLVPAAVTLVSFGVPATAILFRVGAYTWVDVQRTGEALALLSPFILSVAGINIIKKVYFALDDRGTLLRIGAFGVVLTGTLGVLLTGPNSPAAMGVNGLVLALSLSTVAQLFAYFFLLHRRLGGRVGVRRILSGVVRIGVASVPLGLVLWGAAGLGRWEDGPLALVNWVVLIGGFGAAGTAYVIAAWLVGVEEIDRVVGMLRRRFQKAR